MQAVFGKMNKINIDLFSAHVGLSAQAHVEIILVLNVDGAVGETNLIDFTQIKNASPCVIVCAFIRGACVRAWGVPD